ncbi:alkaline phosphatase family protein [Paludisphaera sp.]|uniref:alkaline phosphatase family protein n=1 Tax=Paludisphaera sp. TaxID=2017432 RepID=UPI00301D4F52
MKILVIGLEGATPEIVFQDERLTTLRGLMEAGCHGLLESVTPPTPVPAWMCLATGRDPGALGVHGLRNRADRSYANLASVDSGTIQAPTIWDRVAEAEGRPILVGVPPGHPARAIAGLSIACSLTPANDRDALTHPAELAARIEAMVGPYPTDVVDYRQADRETLRDRVLDMSRKQFEVVRRLMAEEAWDYLQFVEVGLDRIQHAYWRHLDSDDPRHDPAGPFAEVIGDYYVHLDEEIARTLELAGDDAIVLIASVHGARRCEGGVAINEWLTREGLLKLGSRPDHVAPIAKLDVDWPATTAWAEGGYTARVHLNVKGREPEGRVDPADYESVRDDLKARLEALAGPDGEPLGVRAHKPEEIYDEVRGIAPDLIVDLGEQAWRAVGGVGYPSIHLSAEEVGPDDCNPTSRGVFILAGSQLPPFGEIEGVGVLDIAPTLLRLAGLPPLPDADGRDFLEGREPTDPSDGPAEMDDDELVRDRLRGLGYIG